MANDCWNYLTITGRPINLYKVYNEYFKKKVIDYPDFFKIKSKSNDELQIVVYTRGETDMKLVEDLSLYYCLDIRCEWDIEYGEGGSGSYEYSQGDLIQKRRRLDKADGR